jgi:hypothetical protein
LAPKIFFISELLLGGSDRIPSRAGRRVGRLVRLGTGFLDRIATNLGMKSAARERTRSGLVLFFPGNFLRQLPNLNSTRFLCFTSKFATNERSSQRKIMLPLLKTYSYFTMYISVYYVLTTKFSKNGYLSWHVKNRQKKPCKNVF